MENSQLDILNIILQSGIVVKSVLACLLFASVVSWGIIFKKRMTVGKLSRNNAAFLKVYQSSENLNDVSLKIESLPASPYRSMFFHGYEELTKIRNSFSSNQHEKLGAHFRDYGLGVLERGLRKGANEANGQLEKFLSTLASIGSISPFIGLFGTVWGIINSFTGLASGGATLDAVAPGIAEALVATAIGLAAAIPAVWFYNHYTSQNSKLNLEMESFGQDFLNSVERTLVQE
jgi:biopolymer transport protein TolQ